MSSRTMSEKCIAVDPQILSDLRNAIIAWIPRRRETVAAMEKLADTFKREGWANIAVQAGSGAIWLASFFSTGGLPSMIATPILGAAPVIGKFFKIFTSSLQESLRVKFDEEVESFTSVIEKFDILNKAIEKSDQKSVLTEEQAKLLNRYSAIKQQIAKARRIASESTKSSMQGLAGLAAPLVENITKVAMQVAENRAISAVLQGFSKETSEKIARAAGQAVGQAVNTEASKFISDIAAAATATVIEKLRKKAMSIAIEAANDVLQKALKEAGITLDAKKAVATVLPFGFAFLKSVVGIKASQEKADVEKELRGDIAESKEEANKIVRDIYIPLLKIAIPFPKNKL